MFIVYFYLYWLNLWSNIKGIGLRSFERKKSWFFENYLNKNVLNNNFLWFLSKTILHCFSIWCYLFIYRFLSAFIFLFISISWDTAFYRYLIYHIVIFIAEYIFIDLICFLLRFYIYIYIYMCVCVCILVWL